MDRRIIALTAAVLVAMVCIVPVVSEDSDADTQETYRYSDTEVYEFRFEIPSTYWDVSSDVFVYIEGSAEHRAMQAYLEDPEDLRNTIPAGVTSEDSIPIGTRMVAYDDYDTIYLYTNYTNIELSGEKVLDPYGDSQRTFYIKAGETFRLSADVVDIFGNPVEWYLSDGFRNYESDTGSFEFEVDRSMVLYMWSFCSSMYTQVTYSVSGVSEPGGSANAYFAACAVITVAILAILVYAGLKPRWSKGDGSAPARVAPKLGKKQLIVIGAVAVIVVAGVAAYYLLSQESADPSPELKSEFEVGDFYVYESNLIYDGARTTCTIVDKSGDMYLVEDSDSGTTTWMDRDGFLSNIMLGEHDLDGWDKTGSEVISTSFGNIRCDVWSVSESGMSAKLWICPDNGILFHREVSVLGETATMDLVDGSIFV